MAGTVDGRRFQEVSPYLPGSAVTTVPDKKGSTHMEKIENAEDLVGKKVTVSVLLKEPNAQGHGVEEITGKVEVANELALAIKPVGSSNLKMLEAAEIDTITAAKIAPRKFKSRRIDPPTVDKVRQHLLLVHGLELEWVNSVTDEQALAAHTGIPHEKLGHHHAEKAAANGTAESSDGDADSDTAGDPDYSANHVE